MSLADILIWLIILIPSVMLHEVAHGFVADKLGDPTARLMGRLTLNPLKHIDPVMTILLPLMLIVLRSPVVFGGAKPVPVDQFNLKEGRKDMAIVSLSGPLTNVLLAIIAAFIIHLLNFAPSANTGLLLLYIVLQRIVQLNLLLAIFNMLPIPPLDGSKLFALLLPERDAQSYLGLSNIGFFIIFFLLAFPIGGFSLSDLLTKLLLFAQSLLGV